MADSMGHRGTFRRALVVDDDGSLQFLVRTVLEQTQYLVDVARDGLDACAKLARTQYDAIICDLMMPHMDGAALHSYLERERRREARHMLFVTGAQLDEDQESWLRGTGCRLLRKPFSLDELSDAVDQLAGVAI